MRYSLGIDLGGTTARVAAASEDGRLHDVGETPLVVGLTPGGEVVVGSGALTLAEDRRVSGFRDRLGQPEPVLLGGTPFGVEALIAQVLRSTVDTVASDVGEWPVRVAVAYPDAWGEYHLDLLWQAAAMAEVGDVVLLTESEARAVDHDEMTSAFAIARGAARWAKPEDQTPPVEPAGLPISGRTAASVLAALAGGAALGVAGATATAGSAGAGAAARIADFGGGRTMADWARGTQSMANYGDGSRMSDFGEGRTMSDFGGGSQPPPQPSVVSTAARAGRRFPVPAVVAAAVLVVAVIAGGIALASRGSDEPDETEIGTDTTAPLPTDAPTTTATAAEADGRSDLIPFLFAGTRNNTQRRLEVGERVGRTEVFFFSGLVGVEVADDGRVFAVSASDGGEIWMVDGDEIELLFRGGSDGTLANPTDLTVRGSGEDLEVFVATPDSNRIARFVPATEALDFFGTRPTGPLPSDGGAASDAPMSRPASIDVDGAGNLWVADGPVSAIYRIDASDRVSVVSGRATTGEPADGASAADVRFQNLELIAGAPDGGAAVGLSNGEIWGISADGRVTKLAGTRQHPDTVADQGDDGPAVNAAIAVGALAFSPDGDLYMATDSTARDIRRIDRNGIIRRIAGGHPVDGVLPGTAHRFGAEAISVDSQGQVYLAEAVANLNYLRRLPPEGVPPDTAAISFSAFDAIGSDDLVSSSDGVLDHTLELFVEGDVDDVILAEGTCGRTDSDAAQWDTVVGNDTPALGVARPGFSMQSDSSGDIALQLDEPTFLVFFFQDDDGVIAPNDRLCLTIVRPDGTEDETTLVIRGFEQED